MELAKSDSQCAGLRGGRQEFSSGFCTQVTEKKGQQSRGLGSHSHLWHGTVLISLLLGFGNGTAFNWYFWSLEKQMHLVNASRIKFTFSFPSLFHTEGEVRGIRLYGEPRFSSLLCSQLATCSWSTRSTAPGLSLPSVQAKAELYCDFHTCLSSGAPLSKQFFTNQGQTLLGEVCEPHLHRQGSPQPSRCSLRHPWAPSYIDARAPSQGLLPQRLSSRKNENNTWFWPIEVVLKTVNTWEDSLGWRWDNSTFV